MVSLRATTLFLSLISSSLAQNLNGLCSGSVSTTNFTDSCGGQWTVYCNADASPSSYGTINNVASFGECMSLCSNDNAQNRCDTVTYTGTTCYLKRGFRNIVRPSNANSATVFYPVPAYPAPVTNGVARSSGCGQPLNSQIVAGGASTQFSATGADGYVRTYNVHVPSTYDPNKAAPLIMAFHGRGDSGSAMESNSGLSIERINPYGISVYPTAIKDQDQQNTWQGDPSYATNRTVDDIGFVRALVTNISAQYCVDTSRVFAAGMSNGGGFVNVLACDPVMSSVFNAFAPHSGAFYTSTGDSNTVCFPNTVLTNDLVHTTCSPSRRVPMIEFHGDADGTIGYFGGGRRGYCLPAIPHWTQDWAIRNNLTSDNVTTVTNGGNLTRYEFGAASGYPGLVTHFRLAGWSHTYSLGANGGPIDSAAFSLNFFYRWTNPNGPTQDYLAPIYTSTASSRVSCPFTVTQTTTTTTTTSSSTSSSSPIITSASSLVTAGSSSGSVATSASAVAAGGPSSTLNGYPVYTDPPTCPNSNGTYYYDPYVGDRVNGLYYFIMCGYDIQPVQNTIIGPSTFQQCFATCDGRPDCTSFTFHANQCYIKRVNGPYISSGGDYIQASQNPVRGNLVTVTGATTTRTTTTTTTTSSSVTISNTGVSSVVSSPSSSLTGSSTTSAATGIVSQASYSCPANDRQQVVDSNGFIYTIGCNSDSTGGGTLTGSARSFNDCFGPSSWLYDNRHHFDFELFFVQHCSIRGKFTVECFFKLTFQSFQSVVECFIGFVVFLQSHIDGFEFIIKFGVKFLVSSIIELIIFVHRWLFLRKFAVEFCIKPVIECLVSFKFFVKSGLEFVVVVHTWLFFSKLPIEFCFEFVIKCLFGSVIYLEFLVIERECFVEPGLEFLVSRWFVFGKFTIKCCLELIFKCLISPFLYFKLISECFLESGISLIVDHRLFIVKLAFKHIFQFCFGPVFERFFGSVICHQLIILIFEPCIIVVKRSSYSCPANDQQHVIDNLGFGYTIGCGNDTTGGGSNAGTQPDFNGCFALCDNRAGCVSFSYTTGTRLCYLKLNVNNVRFTVASNANNVAAIRDTISPGSSSSSSAAGAAASSSSSVAGAAPSSSSLTSALQQSSTSSSVVPLSSSTFSSSSSSTLPSVIAVSTSSSVSRSLAGSSTSSAATGLVSQASYSCPANERQRVIDNYGAEYTIGCSSDTTGGGTLTGNPSSFNDCFQYCDATPGCNGFTYSGNCYLKLNFPNIAFEPATDGRVGAIRAVQATGFATTTTTTTSASSSRAASPLSSSSSSVASVISSSASSLSSSVSSAVSSVVNPGTTAVSSSSAILSSLASSGSSRASVVSSSVSSLSSSISSAAATSSLSSASSSRASVISSVASSLSSSLSSSLVSPASSAAASSASMTSAGAASSVSSPNVISSSPPSSAAASSTISSSAVTTTEVAPTTQPTLEVSNEPLPTCGGSSVNSTDQCASDSGTVYAVTGGYAYVGETYDTSSVVLDDDGNEVSRPALSKRAYAPTLRACLAYCDRTTGCAGTNYFANNGTCTLFSRITGATPDPNSSSAIFVATPEEAASSSSQYEATATLPPSTASTLGSITASPSTSSSLAPSSTITGPYWTSTATPLCPAADGTYYTDSNNALYQIRCNSDSEGNLIASVGTNSRGIRGCMEACDSTTGCVAFTYSADDTRTQGTCYLRSALNRVVSGASDSLSVGILVRAASPSSSPSSSRSTSSLISSGPAAQSSSTRSSASAAPSLTSSSSSRSSSVSSRSSSSVAPAVSQATYSCPANDQQRVVDSYGAVYRLGCGNDTNSGGTSAGAQPDFNACFALCDARQGCVAWSFNAQKRCFLKLNFANPQFTVGDVGNIAAIREGVSPGFSSISTTMLSTTGSAAASSILGGSSSAAAASSSTSSRPSSASSSSASASSSTSPGSSSIGSSARQSSTTRSDTRIPITPSPYSTYNPSASSSATATYLTKEAAPPSCTQPTCPAIDDQLCTDADGKAYVHKCDTAVTGGTVIVPSTGGNSKRDAELLMFDDMMMTMYSEDEAGVGLKKRQTTTQQAAFQSCQLQCDDLSYCRAIAYDLNTNNCQMFAQVSGTGYSPGVLYAQRAPARDVVSGPVTSTIYSTDITTVTSCAPGVQSCPASSTVVSTSLVPVSVTVSSAAPTATVDYRSYCGGYFSDSQTPSNNYSVDCTSGYTTASISTVTSVRNLNVCVNICSSTANCLGVTYIESGPNARTCGLSNANDLSSTTPFPAGTVGYRATRLTNPGGPLTITRYSTDITTVTSCSSGVQSCPASSTVVSTSLVPIGITVVSSTSTAASSSSVQVPVTSTIYSTSLTTITSCSPGTPNCPASSTIVSTSLISIGTSVVSISSPIVGTPIATSTSTTSSSASLSSSSGGRSGTASTVSSSAVGVVTSTIYSTDITTITSCSPGVLSCPASSTVVSTSLVPISVTVSTVFTEFSTSWYTSWSGTPFSTASSTAYSSGFSTAFSTAFSSAYSSAFSSAFSSAYSSAFSSDFSSAFSTGFSTAFSTGGSTAFSTGGSTAFSTAVSSGASSAASSAASSVASSAASSFASSAASSAASSYASSAASSIATSGGTSYASSTAASGVAPTLTPSGTTDGRSGTASSPISTSTSTFYTGPITITVRPSTCPALKTLTTTVFTTGYVSSCAPDVVCSSSRTL
ncbi:hypothetical protein D6C86_01961 [Aureobasidium pullulans]|uniref:feruloyl esterase n=1 Tax=Aureobasidium pullulans TaxID=5580 RepID=A0A4S9Q709_AURPU|nr:hypothetical protein D6C94_00981 [Aureobasidium pullulans]THZ65494.1 hypothetical protein D6C86_01961 [Aureobasidium pullulans]THZ92154.1 hypothetical protein D6C88_03287 [Aureobasidium pullulans]